jgi:hypothetical protein
MTNYYNTKEILGMKTADKGKILEAKAHFEPLLFTVNDGRGANEFEATRLVEAY